MKVSLIRITDNPVEAIELAASNCYNSKPNNGKVMDACCKAGHLSVMEFCYFHFHIEGVSRSLLAQITRHRLASFEVRSQRYCEESDFNYTIPDSIKSNKTAKELFEYQIQQIRDTYNSLINEYNIPKEDARFILPEATHTIIDMCIDGRSLMNFMNLRLCNRAEWEIRKCANLMKNEIIKVEPKFAKYLVPKCMINAPYNFCTENKCCGLSPRLKDIYNGDKN